MFYLFALRRSSLRKTPAEIDAKFYSRRERAYRQACLWICLFVVRGFLVWLCLFLVSGFVLFLFAPRRYSLRKSAPAEIGAQILFKTRARIPPGLFMGLSLCGAWVFGLATKFFVKSPSAEIDSKCHLFHLKLSEERPKWSVARCTRGVSSATWNVL